MLESQRIPCQAQRKEMLWLKAAMRKEGALGRGVALGFQEETGTGSTKTGCGPWDTEKHRGVEETQKQHSKAAATRLHVTPHLRKDLGQSEGNVQ